MQRNKAIYSIAPGTAGVIKQRMLNWANQFNILCFLDSNKYPSVYEGYDCLLAVGAHHSPGERPPIESLSALQHAHDAAPDWYFGHIGYDYKNELENRLVSAHSANTGFPLMQFFIPVTVCHINREQTALTIETFEMPDEVYKAIMQVILAKETDLPKLQFTKTITKEVYLDTIVRLREHIADGDCYEINYCTEGYCRDVDLEPLQVFNNLNKLSPAPFAAYYRLHDKYMMCASPERYIYKRGRRLLSQPIKGTARRDINEAKDNKIKEALYNDIKERAENVMIVDLVRNDMARCCETGSVQVDELFGIYTFPQVHQMISTVSGTMRSDLPFTDALRTSFPMGSMTGAPKYKVMQLIEQYEASRRELFSGTLGYISPAGDFDFNVIIRSLFYNAIRKYLSYQTGGAITYDSDAEKEWDEMRLKAWAMERLFE